MSDKWHYFVFEGFEYLVLGYNPKLNNCLVFCLDTLGRRDQEELGYIVNSEAAQKEAYLVAILARSLHSGGGMWWERLMARSFFVDRVHLKDRVASKQLAIFENDYNRYDYSVSYTGKLDEVESNATPTQTVFRKNVGEWIVDETKISSEDVLYSPIKQNREV